VFAPQTITPVIYTSGGGLPTRLMPQAQGVFASTEYYCTVQINAKGLRDVEHSYDKPRGHFRILGLGDSYTFGYGVSWSDCYLTILKRRLNGNSQPIEVINAGCPRWGTADELIFLTMEGVKYQPDLVLLAFHDNDVTDTSFSRVFRLVHRRLVRNPAPPQQVVQARRITRLVPFYSTLAQHSHLLNLLRNTVGSRRAIKLHQSYNQNSQKRAGGLVHDAGSH
jgi:hypothetical protein